MVGIEVTPRKEGENNRQYAWRILYDNIIKLRLKPGTILNENELSGLLQVSRTPIREAVLQLKDHHLVEVYPQKASVVTRINLGLLHEGFFLRSEIEPLIYEIVCQGIDPVVAAKLSENIQAQKELTKDVALYDEFFKLDSQFHEIVYHAAKKGHVWRAIQSVSSQFHRIRYFDAADRMDNIELFYQDHKTIYYSVISGSFKPILKMYPHHLAFYQKSLPRLLEECPDYFEI